FSKKFKYKVSFVKDENILSREFKIYFLDNKSKVLDKYEELAEEVPSSSEQEDDKKFKDNKKKKNFKRRFKKKK
ncbi:MAG: ribonuclease E/G, partial [Pelagibacteraceae bacterium]